MRILMCEPKFYGIDYEINPWMDVKNKVNTDLAMDQWVLLRDLIVGLGAKVEYVESVKGLPDMVFTANAGFPHQGHFFVSSFKHHQRKGEEIYFEKFFLDKGYTVSRTGMYFEGMGDVLPMGQRLWCGWGFRSSESVARWLAKQGNFLECVSLSMRDPRFYHLDTCFCPLDKNNTLVHAEAFFNLPSGLHDVNYIMVPPEEARNFACNAIAIGKHVILPQNTDKTCAMLEDLGFQPHPTPMSEFMKSGGACKCLTLKF